MTEIRAECPICSIPPHPVYLDGDTDYRYQLKLGDKWVTCCKSCFDLQLPAEGVALEAQCRQYLQLSGRLIDYFSGAWSKRKADEMTKALKPLLKLCPPGSPLRAEVEEHLARWEAARG